MGREPTMTTIVIRKADNLSDFESMLNVVRSYSLTEAEWPHAHRLLEQEFDERHGNRELYIAWEGLQPVGICQLILKNADNDSQLADGSGIAHVHHLRVLKPRRRQGLGRRLMCHAECESRILGRDWLTVGVDSWNDAAIAFYTALGYAQFKEATGPIAAQKVFYLKKELL